MSRAAVAEEDDDDEDEGDAAPLPPPPRGVLRATADAADDDDAVAAGSYDGDRSAGDLGAIAAASTTRRPERHPPSPFPPIAQSFLSYLRRRRRR